MGRDVHPAGVDACHKCACEDVQNEALYHHYSDDAQTSQIFELSHVISVYLCGPDEQIERIPEQSSVKSSRQA